MRHRYRAALCVRTYCSRKHDQPGQYSFAASCLISRPSSGVVLYIVINSGRTRGLLENCAERSWNEFFHNLHLPFVAGLEARDARRWLRVDFARWNHRVLGDNGQLVARRCRRMFALSAVTDSGRFNHRQEPRHSRGERDQRLGIGMLFLNLPFKSFLLTLGKRTLWKTVAGSFFIRTLLDN